MVRGEFLDQIVDLVDAAILRSGADGRKLVAGATREDGLMCSSVRNGLRMLLARQRWAPSVNGRWGLYAL